MKHLIVVLTASLLVACAAPGADPVELQTDGALAPSLSETQDKKTQKSQRASPGNTYAETCGPLGERFRATNPTRIWEERIGNGVQANQASGAKSSAVGQLEHVKFPTPKYPKGMRISGACDLIMDVSVDGVPTDVEAICSDPDFEHAAILGMQAARFNPVLVSGQPTAYKAMIYPMEFCRND
jgi:hypothetical protein